MCIFVSSDKGVSYKCETCIKKLKAIGKLKKPVLLVLWVKYFDFDYWFDIIAS